MPLPREHLLDELATAYVQAVAAAAGATIAVSRRDYGIDGTLKHIVMAGNKFIESGFPVEFQLKGTTDATIGVDHLLYDLKVRNYDLIVTRPQTGTPCYLFLVSFGNEIEEWIEVQTEQLILRASAYWWKESGAPTQNTSTVRVKISVENRLTSRAIEDMLIASKDRFVL